MTEWIIECLTQPLGSETNQVSLMSKCNYFYSTIHFYLTVQKFRFIQEHSKLFYEWLTKYFTQLIGSNTLIHSGKKNQMILWFTYWVFYSTDPTHWFIQKRIEWLYEWITECFTQLNGPKKNQVTLLSKLNYFLLNHRFLRNGSKTQILSGTKQINL